MLKIISRISLTRIVLLGLLLKLALFCYISPWNKNVEKNRIVVSDSWQYEAIAENLLKYHTFSSPVDTITPAHFSDYRLTGYLFLHPDSYREPGYPLFMAAIYFIFGIKPFMAILVQILLSSIILIFCFKIALLLFNNEAIAKLSTLLVAIDIHSIFVANELLTDTLLLIFFLPAVYHFLKGMKNYRWQHFAYGGILSGLACLTKPIVLLYPGVLLIIILFFSAQPKVWSIKMVLLFALLCGGITSIWLIRNRVDYGHWQMTTQGGNDLLFYYSSLSEQRVSHNNLDSIRVKFQREADSAGFKTEKDIFNQSAIYKQLAISYISSHKLPFFISHLEGGRNMYLSIGNHSLARTLGWANDKDDSQQFAVMNSQRVLSNFKKDKRETLLGILILLIMLVEYGGTAYGIMKLYIDKQFMFIILLVLTVGYLWAIAGVLGSYRYKLPVIPFICVAAAYGYVKLFSKKDKSLTNSAG